MDPLHPRLRAAARAAPTSRDFRRVPATAHEIVVWQAAVAAARACGWRGALRSVVVNWFAGRGEWDPGGMTFLLETPVVVLLQAGLEAQHLYEVAIHELGHLVDAGRRDLSSFDLERRADAFCDRVLARFPHPHTRTSRKEAPHAQ